jgi:hypothetical protein
MDTPDKVAFPARPSLGIALLPGRSELQMVERGETLKALRVARLNFSRYISIAVEEELDNLEYRLRFRKYGKKRRFALCRVHYRKETSDCPDCPFKDSEGRPGCWMLGRGFLSEYFARKALVFLDKKIDEYSQQTGKGL